MRTIHISFAFNELEYGAALARSLLRVNRFFSIGDQINEPYDLLLTDDLTSVGEKVVYFTEEQSAENIDEARNTFIIYKYQHAGRISKMLRLAHSLHSDTELLSDACEESEIISFCSSAGGTGCTSVAMGICLELARFHRKKVIYITLEEFESTAMLFPEDSGGDQNITRFLYRLLHGNGKRMHSIAGYLIQNEFGISSFRPSKGRNPLRELDQAEFVKFMNEILKDRQFTHVILDCGNGMDDSIVSAMKLSGSICHVTGKTTNLKRKLTYKQTALNLIGAKEKIGWLDVSNFHDTTIQDNGEDYWETLGNHHTIPLAESSFMLVDGNLKIAMDKDFGLGIRRLLSKFCSSNE